MTVSTCGCCCLQGARGLPGLTGDPGPAGLDGSQVSHNK